jgi:hypothetical protein
LVVSNTISRDNDQRREKKIRITAEHKAGFHLDIFIEDVKLTTD